jgi:hypothetical protein
MRNAALLTPSALVLVNRGDVMRNAALLAPSALVLVTIEVM